MKPKIERTKFGSITVEGESFEHDIVIGLDGVVRKRKKKLSKSIYGTSHIVSLQEIQALFEPGAQSLIIGNGQMGALSLSNEAAGFLADHGCQVVLKPTPQAIQAWNQASGRVIGLFHVTC